MTTILIIKLGALGDVLRTTSILPGLHQNFPDPSIVWLTANNAVCLLKDNPLIDSVMPMNDSSLSTLKKHSYDLIISLDDDKSACNLAATLKAKQLFGAYYRDGLTCYTSDSSNWFDMSLISVFGKKEADKRKRSNQRSYPDLLCHGLGIRVSEPSLKLRNNYLDFAHRFASSNIKPGKPVVGLNTGAGSRWEYKQLGVNKTIDLVESLAHNNGRDILLYGGPEETERNRKIVSGTSYPIIDTNTTNSILEFAALISLVDVLVTSDSLALHLGSALGISMVVFFGPTSAVEIELFTPGAKIVADLPCVCCYKKRCNFSTTCMDVISTDTIVQAVDNLLPQNTHRIL